MPPEALFDLSQVDFTKVVADRVGIRAVNPQRFEMEQLEAIVHLDPVQQLVIGYKDVRPDEFWVAGHMPGFPLMPGVLMCETAAQLCSFYVRHLKLVGGDFFAFQGMNDVRFRGSVSPGCRFVVIAQATRIHPRLSRFTTQGFVGTTMVFHGDVMGVQLNASPGP
jgi:3-hydroxyacyl-[acyl-carrier-protein] dehydratase